MEGGDAAVGAAGRIDKAGEWGRRGAVRRSELAGDGREPVLSRTPTRLGLDPVPSSSPLTLPLAWDFGISSWEMSLQRRGLQTGGEIEPSSMGQQCRETLERAADPACGHGYLLQPSCF